MGDSTMKILMGEYDADDIRVYKNSPVNIGDVCSRLVRLLKPVALRNGMELSSAITDNVPVVSGDVDALTQLVWNILQNAITHSGGKTIELTVETDGGNVKVTVNDDGAGVETDILPRIFERGISGKKDGSGIGLAICYDITKRHGGEITVKSEPETGTVVTVILRGGGENV
jgi:signal transduction histidine kinase